MSGYDSNIEYQMNQLAEDYRDPRITHKITRAAADKLKSDLSLSGQTYLIGVSSISLAEISHLKFYFDADRRFAHSRISGKSWRGITDFR